MRRLATSGVREKVLITFFLRFQKTRFYVYFQLTFRKVQKVASKGLVLNSSK